MKNIAIIGAGLSGLTCAKHLSLSSKVTIFEKSRGVSGRMSTRYAGEYEFDHGAQYFTARHPDFKSCILEAISEGHIAPWTGLALYDKGQGKFETDRGSDRFVAVPRMNSWAKSLAKGLNIELGVRIKSIETREKKWALLSDEGEIYDGFDELVLAIPSPQALTLLPDGFSKIEAVRSAAMDACFALMLGFDTKIKVPWDSLRVKDSPIAWIAVNSAKPERGAAATLMVHTHPDWSNENADEDRSKLMQIIVREASRITGIETSSAVHKSLHRWLYASVSNSPNTLFLRDEAKHLTLCGDWCLGGRVEAAWLSGRAASKAILARS